LASTDALAEIGSAANKTATDNRRRRSMPEATAESLAACEGREGMTIQADLAARFLDTMTAKLEKGRKAGADGVRIELADLDLLIKMAEPSADALDHVVTQVITFLELAADGVRIELEETGEPERLFSAFVPKLRALAEARCGVDLASGPDSTAVTKVEIVDGSANVREMVHVGPVIVDPSLAEALEQGNK
jgi:hypothetical protein